MISKVLTFSSAGSSRFARKVFFARYHFDAAALVGLSSFISSHGRPIGLVFIRLLASLVSCFNASVKKTVFAGRFWFSFYLLLPLCFLSAPLKLGPSRPHPDRIAVKRTVRVPSLSDLARGLYFQTPPKLRVRLRWQLYVSMPASKLPTTNCMPFFSAPPIFAPRLNPPPPLCPAPGVP